MPVWQHCNQCCQRQILTDYFCEAFGPITASRGPPGFSSKGVARRAFKRCCAAIGRTKDNLSKSVSGNTAGRRRYPYKEIPAMAVLLETDYLWCSLHNII